MFIEQLKIALAEFWLVAWVLVLLIAGISVLTGFVREYIPQEKIAILSSMLKPKGIVAFALTVFVIATLGGVLFMFI